LFVNLLTTQISMLYFAAFALSIYKGSRQRRLCWSSRRRFRCLSHVFRFVWFVFHGHAEFSRCNFNISKIWRENFSKFFQFVHVVLFVIDW